MKEEDPTRVNQKVVTEFMLFYKIKHQALLFLLILVLQFKKQLDSQKSLIQRMMARLSVLFHE